MTSIPEHARQAGTPAVSTPSDWKNTVLAGLANYIDAGSIAAGSVALAIWAKQFLVAGVALSPLGILGASLPTVTARRVGGTRYPPFGTSWRAAKIVVQGARERMFCPVTPIRTPCSRLLACRPADLICR